MPPKDPAANQQRKVGENPPVRIPMPKPAAPPPPPAQHQQPKKEPATRAVPEGALFSATDNYWRAHYLAQPVTLTIRLVDQELITTPGQFQKEWHFRLHFVESPKKLILNQPNTMVLVEFFGDDIKAAIGKQVRLSGVKIGGRPSVKLTPVGTAANTLPDEDAPEGGPDVRISEG